MLVRAVATLLVLGAACAAEAFNASQALADLGINVPTSSAPASPCSTACTILLESYGDSAVFARNTPRYANFTGSYWSAIQDATSPYCVFQPPTASGVSALVLVARVTGCPFAVKSGGHAAFAGASSIAGGITLSLARLTAVTLAADRKSVRVEPGNTAVDVYAALAADGVAIVSGRVASIGVGGFTLGGGISYLSARHGLACDNVLSFDVVLADGSRVTARPGRHAALYWALRGGGNNFGIVVGFEFVAVPLPRNELWAGTRLYAASDDHAAQLVDAFATAIVDAPRDPDAGLWVAWVAAAGQRLASATLWRGAPSAQESVLFAKFARVPSLSDSTGNTTLVALAELMEASNPPGLREVYYALTVRAGTPADAAILTASLALFWDGVAALQNLSGITPAFIWQGFTVPELAHTAARGGNPLGLRADGGPYFLMQISCSWKRKTDDARVYAAVSGVLAAVRARALALGVQHDYVYMNYGSQFQDVIASYGIANKARLQAVARAYDPAGVFQTLQPGYFKLHRAPVPDSGYFSF